MACGLGLLEQPVVLAGVVDSDYRGEVMVALLNSGDEPLELRKGDKVAQQLAAARKALEELKNDWPQAFIPAD